MAKGGEAPVERTSSRLKDKGIIKSQPVEKVAKATKPKKEPKEEKKVAAATAAAEAAEAAPAVKAASPAKKEVKASKWTIGQKIHSIVLKDENAKDVNLLDVAHDHGFVVFFYPKANTPGCTTQAISFRDEYAKFEKLGFKVFGCSKDSPRSQTTFKTKFDFPYSLLSDPEMHLIAAVGSKKSDGRITRSHVVVAKGGVVLDITEASPKDSCPNSLKSIAKA